jgi:hypothetical protein
MATNFVSGVEKVFIAPAFFTEADASTAVWTELEYITTDTVAYTKNSDTTTDLFAEDKSGTVLTFATDGEPYTPATTKIVTLAKRKLANLAFKIITRSVKDDRKQQIVIPNTTVVTTSSGNLTKTGIEGLVLTGKVGIFKTTTGNLDAINIKTWITEAGAVIDSTP